MTAKTVAKRTPPKIPWMVRKMMSSVMFCERPQRAEATTKPTMPVSRNGFRPNRSPSLPATGTITVEATR